MVKKETILEKVKEGIGEAIEKVEETLGLDKEKLSSNKKKTSSIKKTEKDVKPKKDAKSEKVEDGEATKDNTILTPIEDYIKTASYLGTKVITPSMRKYIYRRRLDGLAILNTLLVDKKLSELIDFVKQYKPNEWTLVCKREAGWRAAKMFSELTDVKTFTKKYPSGVLTNTQLSNFIETKMLMICDPWLDKNALKDAKKVRIPVAGICDTNNHTSDIDVVAIANNKSNKSLGLLFWLLSREYMKAHNIDKKLPSLEDFVGEKLILEEPRKKKKVKEQKEQELKSAEAAIEERMKQIAEREDSNVKSEIKKQSISSDEDENVVKVGEGASQGV